MIVLFLEQHPDGMTITMSAPATPERDSRYLSLDAWRGLACLMLVLHHTSFYVAGTLDPHDPATWTLPGAVVKFAHLAWIGVPLFFVVSGYCIAASVNSLQRRPYSLTSFFARRIRRIYPPLWCACAWAVIVTCLIAVLVPGLYERCPQLPRLTDFSTGNWIGNMCASESWQHHLTGARTAYLMSNTWTLCFEEQFYLVSGLLLALSARRFFLGAFIVTVLTLAGRHGGRHLDLDWRGLFMEGHWLLFAAGLLLFYQLNRASLSGRRWISLSLVAGMIYAVIDRARGATNGADWHIDEYLFIACAFALLLGQLRRFDAALMRSVIARPFLWCGKRSYSIYLTHYPLVVALTCALHLAGLESPALWLLVSLPLSVLVALASGWLFHLLIERHFLNAPLDARQSKTPAASDAGPSITSAARPTALATSASI
jgi:peptidoglycan/LPS O-acetylase OafA/YrhL